MPKSELAKRARRLREQQGFDRSRVSWDHQGVEVRCSQCEASVVNNVAIHERGCPNERRRS